MRYVLVLLAYIAMSPTSLAAVTAKSWLVSSSTGSLIASENIDEVRSIASITKLLLVVTVLDAHQDLDHQLALSNKIHDRLPRKLSTLSRRQLIELALVNSDNRAAQTLCENYHGGFDSCVMAMNNKLRSLSMYKSVVYEPTGLDARNVSTAKELVQLIQAARQYPVVLEDSRKTKVEIKIKKKFFVFPQTNSLVGKTQKVIVTKTGYTNPAGGCLVMLIETNLGERIVVVLGSKNTHTRIPEAEIISRTPAQ